MWDMGALCRYSSESSNQYACMYLKIGCCRSVFYLKKRGGSWSAMADSTCMSDPTSSPNLIAFSVAVFIAICWHFSISSSPFTVPYFLTFHTAVQHSRSLLQAAPATQQPRPASPGQTSLNMSTTPPDTEILNPADEEFYASYVSSYS